MKNKKLIVISGASGVGKTTLLKAIRRERSELQFSVSTTDRPPRPEEEADAYEYVSTEVFEDRIRRGEFLEYVFESGVYYGTKKDSLTCSKGRIILDIDTKGGTTIKQAFPAETLLIFISAPEAVIEQRLRGREGARMDPAVIEARLARRKTEFDRALAHYDYIVENVDFRECLRQVLDIIDNS